MERPVEHRKRNQNEGLAESFSASPRSSAARWPLSQACGRGPPLVRRSVQRTSTFRQVKPVKEILQLTITPTGRLLPDSSRSILVAFRSFTSSFATSVSFTSADDPSSVPELGGRI